MKHVVCIDASGGYTGLVEGQIYECYGLGHVCEGIQLIHIKNGSYGWGICPNCLTNYHGWNHHDPKRFRPVDDTFGEVIAEIISKQVELEETEKQLI